MLLKLIVSLGALMIVMGALIFVSAGTFDYWQAWLFLACYFVASLVVSLWLIGYDRALLERRMRGGPFAEGERSQKLIMTIASLGFIALLVVPGLDHRFGWSVMPTAVALLGEAALLSGWAGILIVFRENSYAASTIEVAPGQKVIATGPYALVRHPMYSSALLMMLGIPLSLGSWWGVLAWIALLPALAWRIIEEEYLLARELDGYADYRQKVRWRLIPNFW